MDIEYLEAAELFPALYKYKSERTTVNFQKLCVEIEDFCRVVYAGTQNKEERQMFMGSITRLQHLNDVK